MEENKKKYEHLAVQFSINILFILILTLCTFTFVNAEEQNLKGKIIYLDAGHGGRDPGAIYKELKESDLGDFYDVEFSNSSEPGKEYYDPGEKVTLSVSIKDGYTDYYKLDTSTTSAGITKTISEYTAEYDVHTILSQCGIVLSPTEVMLKKTTSSMTLPTVTLTWPSGGTKSYTSTWTGTKWTDPSDNVFQVTGPTFDGSNDPVIPAIGSAHLTVTLNDPFENGTIINSGVDKEFKVINSIAGFAIKVTLLDSDNNPVEKTILDYGKVVTDHISFDDILNDTTKNNSLNFSVIDAKGDPVSLSDCKCLITYGSDKIYDSTETSYNCFLKNLKGPGDYYVTVVGRDQTKLKEEKSSTFTVTSGTILFSEMTQNEFEYNGSSRKEDIAKSITVKNIAGTVLDYDKGEYDIQSNSNNFTDVKGELYLTVVGKGNYINSSVEGSSSKNTNLKYSITKRSFLSHAQVTVNGVNLDPGENPWTGQDIKPTSITITDDELGTGKIKEDDYTISYLKNGATNSDFTSFIFKKFGISK